MESCWKIILGNVNKEDEFIVRYCKLTFQISLGVLIYKLNDEWTNFLIETTIWGS